MINPKTSTWNCPSLSSKKVRLKKEAKSTGQQSIQELTRAWHSVIRIITKRNVKRKISQLLENIKSREHRLSGPDYLALEIIWFHWLRPVDGQNRDTSLAQSYFK